MAILESHFPAGTLLPIHSERIGPVRAAEFETWPLEDDNPYELIAGWVVPMSPGTYETGQRIGKLFALLMASCDQRGWSVSLDARHRLPDPANTTVFPDLVVHCTDEIGLVPRSKTVARVPDLVIELLSDETAERDRGPNGAKFRAYEMSGVGEYYYAWPDGTEAAGYRRENGAFAPIEPDTEGYFESPLLGGKLRLVPAGLLF